MKCYCCDVILSDAEATARHPETNEFLDTCFKCLQEIGITPVVRQDLLDKRDDSDDEWEVEEYQDNWGEDE